MDAEIELLQTEFNALCQKIEPSPHVYTFLTDREDNGSPHVEYFYGEYHYVVTEHGSEVERRSTTDINEILYWLIYDLTFWMGVAYELKKRVEGPDVRRVIFAHWMDLMKKADPAYADRLNLHIAETLAANPFVDQDSS